MARDIGGVLSTRASPLGVRTLIRDDMTPRFSQRCVNVALLHRLGHDHSLPPLISQCLGGVDD